MARNKSPYQIQLEYLPLRGLWGLLQFMPWALGEKFCRILIEFILLFIPKRRQMMLQNVAFCFPEKPAVEHQQIANGSLANLAREMALYPHIPELVKNGMSERVELIGAEHLDAGFQKGQGIIAFTAHYGCWEIMPVVAHLHYPRVTVVARPLDNPRLEQFTAAVRGASGARVIPQRQALREGLFHLRNNGILGILIDQNFYKGGLFVDFFGRPAATTSIVSLLARRTGAVVLPLLHNRWKRQPEPGDFVYSAGRPRSHPTAVNSTPYK